MPEVNPLPPCMPPAPDHRFIARTELCQVLMASLRRPRGPPLQLRCWRPTLVLARLSKCRSMAFNLHHHA